MKRPYKILLIILGAVVLAVLVVIGNVSRSRSTVRGIEVNIRQGRVPQLVDDQTVRDSIVAALPSLLQHSVGSVDREAVAEAAARVPYLKEVGVAVSVSGKVVVRARQRRPIARLYYGNQELYIDDEGVVMPSSPLGNCNVLVAGGDFAEPLRPDSLNRQVTALWQVARFLDKESKYGELIDQIYIERDGDIMMVPKLGGHVVELGSPDDLDEKFDLLLAFYRKGMPRAGWDTYSRVSLKYHGQVVCTKRNETK
ncbi:MAG: hypothetical protein IJ524_06850 [Bacteroidales bacterium]|nr:hypothetical protein [Bacteroidales bacterium]